MSIVITSQQSGGMSWEHEAAPGDTVLVIFTWMAEAFDPEIGNQRPVDRAFYGTQAIPLHTEYGPVGSGTSNSLGDESHQRAIQVLWLSLPEIGNHTITLESDHGYSMTSVSYMISGSIGPLIPFLATNGASGNQAIAFDSSEPPGTVTTGSLLSNGSEPSTENLVLGAIDSTAGATNSATDDPLANVGTQEVVGTFGDTLVIKKYPSSPVFFGVGGYVDSIQFDISDGDIEEDYYVTAGIILPPTPEVEPPPEPPTVVGRRRGSVTVVGF